jgi:hypothetical protein
LKSLFVLAQNCLILGLLIILSSSLGALGDKIEKLFGVNPNQEKIAFRFWLVLPILLLNMKKNFASLLHSSF